MKIISRLEAAKLGLKKFYTGKPCRHGHMAERYVSTQACLACLRGMDAIDVVKLTFMVHPKDEATVREYVEAVAAARTLTPETELEADERGYWAMIGRLRSAGCPAADLRTFREFRTYRLPDGVDP